MATGPHVRQKTIQVDMTDVSTATTRYLISPYRGWVERIDVALHGAVTTAANAVTVSIDSVAQAGLAFTIPIAAAGTRGIGKVVNRANHGVIPGSAITIVSDGAGSGTAPATFFVTIRT